MCIRDSGGAVDLGVAGGVGVSGQGGQVVPVLGNFAVLVEAEDVEMCLRDSLQGHLLELGVAA